MITSRHYYTVAIIIGGVFLHSMASNATTIKAPDIQEILTSEERTWLAEHPVITFTPDPNFPPIEFFNKKGQFTGIVADYIALLENRLNVEFRPIQVNNWIEAKQSITNNTSFFLSANVNTSNINNTYLYTETYLQFPVVLLAREHVKQEVKLTSFRHQRLAVVKDHPEYDIIQSQYPDIHIVDVGNIEEGLRITAFGQVDAMVALLPVASFYLEKEGITNLRVVGIVDFDMPISMSMLKDNAILNNILNKTLANITQAEKLAILRRWVTLSTTLNPNHTLIINISLIAFIIILLVVIWALQIRRQRSLLQSEISLRKAHEKELQKVLLELEKMNQKLETLAVTDTLTGVKNRRGFYDRIEHEIKRAQRFKEVFSLLMIDADHFKAINDNYGHITGDEALKHIAQVLLKSARELDTIFRFGGEEFTLILPRTSKEEAYILAERIRQHVAEQVITISSEQTLQLTISIGIADSANLDPITVDSLIKKADKTLYQAKHKGRNRVCLSPT